MHLQAERAASLPELDDTTGIVDAAGHVLPRFLKVTPENQRRAIQPIVKAFARGHGSLKDPNFPGWPKILSGM